MPGRAEQPLVLVGEPPARQEDEPDGERRDREHEQHAVENRSGPAEAQAGRRARSGSARTCRSRLTLYRIMGGRTSRRARRSWPSAPTAARNNAAARLPVRQPRAPPCLWRQDPVPWTCRSTGTVGQRHASSRSADSKERGRRRRRRHGGSHLRPVARGLRGRGDGRRAGVLRRGGERKDLGLRRARTRSSSSRISSRTTAKGRARPSGSSPEPASSASVGRSRISPSIVTIRFKTRSLWRARRVRPEGHRGRAPDPRRARLSLDALRPPIPRRDHRLQHLPR